MVIRLVSHCHALLLQSAATLLVDLHPCIDGRLGGVLAENTAHLMEHPKDSGSHRRTGEVVLMVNEILRVGVALCRCLCEIAQSFFAVCLHLLSQQIELSQRVLGKRISLRGRVLQKLNGCFYILRHTFHAGEQQFAQRVCGASISGFCRFLKPLCRCFSVSRYAKPVLICLSKMVGGNGIALLPQTVEGDQCH